MGNPKNKPTPECNELYEPKPEVLDFIFPSDAVYSMQVGDNNASSSGNNVRSFLTGMGFTPLLVDKVIEENGDDNVDLLLEILVKNSDTQKSSTQSSDSLDNLFDDKAEDGPAACFTMLPPPKEEPDVYSELLDERRQSLLGMNFTLTEVEFAINKLGDNASIGELVDFISAVQMAQHVDEGTDDKPQNIFPEYKDDNDETLFGTMEKTLQLLDMGFSENEISSAIEKFGSEVPVLELANCICAEQVGEVYVPKSKVFLISPVQNTSRVSSTSPYLVADPLADPIKADSEHMSQENISCPRDPNREATRKGKRPRQVYPEESPHTQFGFGTDAEDYEAKLKPEYIDGILSSYIQPEWEEKVVDIEMPSSLRSSRKPLSQMAARRPYFFYGSVTNLPMASWSKMSEFMHGVEPEFVNTQFFSALKRREGYLHNLPIENRFHILPKPPMSIQESIPQSKQWWPDWDTREKLTFINSDVVGVSQVCDRLGMMLRECQGKPSAEQRQELLHYCQRLNLTWVGPNRLGPIEPDYVEIILGYQLNHTEVSEVSLTERLQYLRHSFQIDALAYHLSTLKAIFPQGITMLSLSTGIGGVEVALHRLGVHLKNLVSVESCEAKRNIMRRWWNSSGQTGELVQINDIEKLTSKRMEELVGKYGCFDFVVCQDSFKQQPQQKPSSSSSSVSPSFDFSEFYEFVRVVQLVRNKCR
ncbi:Probable inactive DNA (cytosine-5)-methyltransferase DRM3 [Linum perenne]